MKICVISRQQQTLDLWSRLFRVSVKTDFVNGSSRSVGADVVMMSGVWAFDRYGGSPDRRVAQILPNLRNDGLPDWIVVPPFRPIVKNDGKFSIREDFKYISPAYHAMMKSLLLVREELGDSVTVALDLLLLGMDDPTDESTPASAAKAVEDFLNE